MPFKWKILLFSVFKIEDNYIIASRICYLSTYVQNLMYLINN